MNGNIPYRLVPLVLPVIFLVIWEMAVINRWVPPSVTAAPSEVFAAFVRMTADGTVFPHIFASAKRLILGFVIGAGLGIALGMAIAVSKSISRSMMFSISIVSPIPITAWIPLLIIFFGIGEFTKVAVIVIGAFFPTFFATLHGVRTSDKGLLELADIYEKSTIRRVVSIYLPSAGASIFIGLRSALGLGWILIVVAEVIASRDGLGWMMWDARNFARPAEMMVAILLTGVLGALSAAALNLAERRLLFWRHVFEGETLRSSSSQGAALR